ncbi:MAG: aspartate--tRNA ligase, partial [Polyangiales bacterium]
MSRPTTEPLPPRIYATRYRTHHAAELDPALAGATVRVAGFVHAKRELGQITFLEVRDASGVVQCVIERGHPAFPTLRTLSLESSVSVAGQLALRAESARNPKLASGAVELLVTSVDVLSVAAELPFAVRDELDAPEELRLRHRFLDLRRARVRRNVELRSRVAAWLRAQLGALGFIEIHTPILTASSPEGARDFLVPSRLSPGKFYALPQAPQLWKQLLMIGGFERYFQIAPCFRDEDARADRSPGEFYQLDLELAYVEQEDIFGVVEPLLHALFTALGSFPVAPLPFPRITYHDALARFGSDKPDLRNPLAYKPLPPTAALEQPARALVLPTTSGRSRRWFEQLRALVQKHGDELSWLVPGKPLQGFVRGDAAPLRAALSLPPEASCLVLHAAPTARSAHELRTHVGRELGVVDEHSYRFCWVVDFPMYERDSKTGAIGFAHNPFSMPQGGAAALEGDVLAILAHQYDIVCNGIELSSGALRNHRPELLLRAFELAGYDASEVEARFGGLLRALRAGAPPHGGIAPGFERIVMLLADQPNLREVTAFPLTQTAEDLLFGAPSPARPDQLAELGLKV